MRVASKVVQISIPSTGFCTSSLQIASTVILTVHPVALAMALELVYVK